MEQHFASGRRDLASSALLDEIARRGAKFSNRVCIVSIAAGNTAATVLTAIRALHARRRTPVEGFRRVGGQDWRAGHAVAEGAGVCMLPERSAIVEGLTLRPVDTLDLSRTIAFQSISGSGTAAALRQLRMLVERYAGS